MLWTSLLFGWVNRGGCAATSAAASKVWRTIRCCSARPGLVMTVKVAPGGQVDQERPLRGRAGATLREEPRNVIQIFGTTKCKVMRAAQRFFADRRIKVQF